MTGKEERIRHLLARNVEEIIEKEHLEKALQSGKKLRVKFGIDPTSPDLHLGHAVILRKLKEFQELGHKVVLIIGDFTARIGDPSGRIDARKPLADAEIKKNMKEYLAQAGKVIDVKKAEIFYNSAWFTKEGVEKIVELMGAASIQQVIRRADFKKRLESDKDVSLLEALYPVLQGYDSVKVSADIEIGGTDQTFNLLMGRKIQRHFRMKEQDILTAPLLVGTDGAKKMSKSYGNFICLTESANEMFGKIMSLPDSLIKDYFLMCTGFEIDAIRKLEKDLSPRDLKIRLGVEIVKVYHGASVAKKAAEQWEKTFSKREMPDDAPVLNIPAGKISAADIVAQSGVAKSKSEAGRLIAQGGFEVNKKKITDPREVLNLKTGDVLKIGKRHFFRIGN